jgi:phage terminase small subunit
MPNKHSELLTLQQLRFVAAWHGSATAAAKAAGYKHPNVAGAKLMNNPAVTRAIRVKQEAILEESSKKWAQELHFAGADILNRLWEITKLDASQTRGSYNLQLQACILLARIFGDVPQS